MPALSNSRAEPRSEIAAAMRTLLSTKTFAGSFRVDAILLFEEVAANIATGLDHLIEVDASLGKDLAHAIKRLHGNNVTW